MPTTTTENRRSAQSLAGAASLPRYMTEISRYRLLTRSQEVALAGRIAGGDEAARSQLIESNLRLVASISREFRGHGIDQLDLIQEGTIGLIAAVDRFEPGHGARFATYAAWWIRHAIQRAVAAQGRTIRLPESMLLRIADVRRAELALTARLGHAPGDEQIGAELGLTSQQVDAARRAAERTRSLDRRPADDDDSSLLDTVADADAPDVSESLASEQRRQLLERSLEALEPRARWVLQRRYGLHGSRELTTAEMADRLRISHGRVRQIEETARRKLAMAADELLTAAA